MNTDNLNRWLTLVANFAVLAGLIALVYEINSNTSAVKSQEWGAIMDSFLEARTTEIENGNIYMKAMLSPSELTIEELHTATQLITSRLLILQRVYKAYLEGTADEADWEYLAGATRTYLGSEFGQKLWAQLRYDFEDLPEFVAKIDEVLESNTDFPADDEWYLNLQESLR